MPETIESSRLDQTFHDALIESSRLEPVKHIRYALVIASAFSFLHEAAHRLLSDVLYTVESVTQFVALDLEEHSALVDVGGKDLRSAFFEEREILLHLVRGRYAVVYDRGEQFYIVISLVESRFVREHRIRRRVRLVERVFRKALHLVEDIVGDVFVYPERERSGDRGLRLFFDHSGRGIDRLFRRCAVQEYVALSGHDVGLLLAHRAAQYVRRPERITRERLHDLHDLFLIDKTAVSHVEYRFEQRMLVGDIFGMVFRLYVFGYAVHRSRTVERYSRYDVFEAVRLQLLHELFHARGFELEHRVGIAAAYLFVDVGIVVTQFFEIHVHSVIFVHVLARLGKVGQSFKPQKVHFEHSHLLDFLFLELRGDVLAVALERHVIGYDFLAYDDARRMLGAVARHALDLERHVHDLAYLRIGLVHFDRFGRIKLGVLLFFRPAEDLGKRDLGIVGDHFGQLVYVGQRHVVNSRDVLYRAFRLHRAQSQDLAYLVLAVFAYDVIYDLAAPFETEVHVEVGRRFSLGIEESFEKKIVLERIHVGDLYRVRDDTAHAGSSARSHGDTVRFGVIYEVPDYQIIFREAFGDYDVELVFGAFPYLGSDLAVTPFEPLERFPAQILFGRGPVVGFVRRLQVLFFDMDVALVHYLQRVGDRFGTPRKDLHHFIVRFEIKLVRVEAHTLRVVYRLARLYAQEHVVHLGVRLFGIMHVVGRDDFDAYLASEFDEQRIDPALFFQTVILYLDIEIPRLEHIPQHYRIRLCPLVIVCQKQFGDLARQTRRKTYHSLAVLPEQIDVDPRFIIKTVHIRLAVHLNEVAVALVVFGYEQKMIEAPHSPALFVHIVAGVEFAAYDRLYPGFFRRLVEREYAEHIAVIGYRKSGHPLFDGFPYQRKTVMIARYEPRRAVQQAEFGMHVQMHERLFRRGRRLLFFLFRFLFDFLRGVFLSRRRFRRLLGGFLFVELAQKRFVAVFRARFEDFFRHVTVFLHPYRPLSISFLSCG